MLGQLFTFCEKNLFPVGRLVAIESSSRRDGRPLEVMLHFASMLWSYCKVMLHCYAWVFCSPAPSVMLMPSPVQQHVGIGGILRMQLSGVVQRLGFYDPLKKETNLNAPAIKKWLGNGALPSKTVANLLKKAMVIE